MLYQSTRNKTDTYTAYRVLHQELKAGEGHALPMCIPVIPDDDLQQILEMPFSDAVSYVLNIFFPGKITAWDVSCAIGKTPARVDMIGQKMLIGVLWENYANSAEFLIAGLYNKLCSTDCAKPTAWARIAINISLIFGLFAELKKQGVDQTDFAAASCDLETVFSAWYARKMGLPVGMILCVCNENSNCWDLLHRGSLNAGAQTATTSLPEMDVQLPMYLENLLYCNFGTKSVLEYLKAIQDAAVFTLDEEQLHAINDGIYACVVGQNRICDVANSVAKTDSYALDPYAAAVYGGVQDYRAKTGKQNYTLIWANHRP